MLVFMVLSYGTFNALLHMVPNTKYTFLSLIIGKPHYSKSKQTLGFERELVNKKVTSILYSHVFRCSLDWFSVRYACNYIENYDNILWFYLHWTDCWLLVQFSSYYAVWVFVFLFWIAFMQMKRWICIKASEWSEFWLNTVLSRCVVWSVSL